MQAGDVKSTPRRTTVRQCLLPSCSSLEMQQAGSSVSKSSVLIILRAGTVPLVGDCDPLWSQTASLGPGQVPFASRPVVFYRRMDGL